MAKKRKRFSKWMPSVRAATAAACVGGLGQAVMSDAWIIAKQLTQQAVTIAFSNNSETVEFDYYDTTEFLKKKRDGQSQRPAGRDVASNEGGWRDLDYIGKPPTFYSAWGDDLSSAWGDDMSFGGGVAPLYDGRVSPIVPDEKSREKRDFQQAPTRRDLA